MIIVPKQEPEFTKLNIIAKWTMFYIFIEYVNIQCVYMLYNGLYDRPFILLFPIIYSIIGIYTIGFALDNSPLLGTTGLFVCYIILYNLQVRFAYHRYIVTVFILLIMVSAYVKDMFSHEIYQKKPIVVNIWLYFILSIMPIGIPFHIYNQNRYYIQTFDGFIML